MLGGIVLLWFGVISTDIPGDAMDGVPGVGMNPDGKRGEESFAGNRAGLTSTLLFMHPLATTAKKRRRKRYDFQGAVAVVIRYSLIVSD
jgi:hypothetical protein